MRKGIQLIITPHEMAECYPQLLAKTTDITEAKVLIEQWRMEYNHIRPHSSLGYRPPAPESILSAAMT